MADGPAGEPGYVTQRSPELRGTSLSSPFAHVARQLHDVVVSMTGRWREVDGATVVDFGSADSPYRHLFNRANYISVDLPGNSDARVHLRTDGTVPLPDHSADLVLSTQVLEHVADPELYLAECVRLLRPGGELVLTTHGIMYRHPDPTDYWRWTADGLSLAVSRSGLDVREVRGILGLLGSSLQLMQAAIGRRVPARLLKPVVVVFQLLIGFVDRRTSDTSRTEDGLVVAVRATKTQET